MRERHELRGYIGETAIALSVLLLILRFFVGNLQNEDSLPSFEFMLLSLCLVAFSFALAYRRGVLPFNIKSVLTIILGLSVIAAVRAPVRWDAILTLLHIASVTIFFLTLLPLFKENENIRLLLYALFALGIVVILYGVYQSLFALKEVEEFLKERPDFIGDERLHKGLLERARLRDAFGLFVLPNGLSAFSAVLLLLTGSVLFEYIRKKRSDISTSLLLFSVAVSLAGMFFSGAKGGPALVILVVLLGAAWHLTKRRRLIKKDYLLPVLMLSLVGAVVIVSLATIPYEDLPPSVAVRAMYWWSGLRMLSDNPLGVGLGNFKHFYGIYKDVRAEDIKLAHNFLVTFGAEVGLAAVAFLTFLIFIVWRRLSGEWKEPEVEPIERRKFLLTALCGVFALIVLILLSRVAENNIPPPTVLVVMLSGWLVLFYLFWRSDPLSSVKNQKRCIMGALSVGVLSCFIDFNAYEGAFAFTIVLICAAGFAMSNTVRYDEKNQKSLLYVSGNTVLAVLLALPLPYLMEADAKHSDGKALLKDGVRAGVKGTAFVEEGVKLLKEATDMVGWNRHFLDDWADGTWRLYKLKKTEKEWEEAVKALRLLLRVNPFSIKAHRYLAFLMFNRGRYEEATEKMRRVVELNGTVPEYWFEYGCLLARAGKRSDAVRAFSEALRLDDIGGAWNRLSGTERRRIETMLKELKKR